MKLRILSIAAALTMLLLACAAATPVQTKKKTGAKKAPAAAAKKKSTASRTAAAAHTATSSARTASAKKGAPARKATTWRNRQLAPTPDRYREIQTALASRGYLGSEEVTGAWSQSSADALKRFQSEQNIESTGKINSLSLIALGLGPRRDPAPASAAGPPKPAIE
jgi:peptidoglycan hydrolase-like protein with peptidoglycan-binding domain